MFCIPANCLVAFCYYTRFVFVGSELFGTIWFHVSELFSRLSVIFFGLSYVIPYIIRVRPFDCGFGYPGFYFAWTDSMW